MKRKYFLSLLVISLILMACTLFSPAQGTVQSPTVGTKPSMLIEPGATNSVPATPAESTALPNPTTAVNNNVTGGPSTGQQPVEVKGTFKFTNDIILTYYVENAVSLTDMYGFVKRDKQWEIPVSSQNIGFLKIDPQTKSGSFHVDLPEQPTGKLVDVNPDGKTETGIQIFAAEYMPNLAGGPYSEGDDPEHGWPAYLASVKTDTENNDEVTGGKLVIWAPDGQQSFPSDFGSDKLLFTQDDPVMPVPQGYSVIDLDQKPFQILRTAQAELTLYEPADAAIKNFSGQSYVDAFNHMFDVVRTDYAFNGIQGKQPNWDQVYAAILPKVQDAQKNKDPLAYFQALRDFTLAFKDGHVGLNGGDVARQWYINQYAGGYGFVIRQLDNGQVMVTYIVTNGPAEKAGMKTGAVVTEFGGKPIDQAIKAVVPPTAPTSTESALRAEQARYLVRAPVGTQTTVTFQNPNETAKTVQLQAIQEQESLAVTDPFRNNDPNGLPVEYYVATNKIGYIKINSSYDDLNLIMRLFKRALDKFKENNLTALVVDLRANAGGANLGLAGFLTNKEIPLGQLEYYSSETGKFEPEGPPDKVTPYQEQYQFQQVFVLVSQACASACELEAYGFSQLPQAVVVGETPTSGTEAEVSRGQFKLPEGMSLQIPTGRFVLPDGSIFLEGKGVQPTERVPVNANTVLSTSDPILQRVVQLVK